MTEFLTAVRFPRVPDAACKNTKHPDLFFSINPREIEQARNICRRCPEIRDCLSWSITTKEHGIWAGTTPEQREELTRRHTRSTP